ncbi:GLUG motif-containing protein [Cohnella silvisoli]|uniref:S-layer homology domain-containing protein n=1 Tax=Cohnella silvisoli TaxID=2873699 RepID=A0ABV1L432_9BACL|nr:GLUG motif-containing protein [Cohnella silvisoli]MCD9026426.1 S-layer homology domain-containing protein [Cohnella silvisoli]
MRKLGNKAMKMILTMIMVFSAISGGAFGSGKAFAAGPAFPGDGTSVNPYLIGTASQLNLVRGAYLDPNTYFKLTDDIDLSGYTSWVPIGDFDTPFYGQMDGNEFKITGLTINDTDIDYMGLFGYLGSGSSLMSMNIKNANLNGNQQAGVLAGYNDGGTISDSYVSGDVSGFDNIGGLVGYNADGEIRNSRSSARVVGGSGSSAIGGLVGLSGGNNAIISDSSASGEVSGKNSVGGLIGSGYSGTVVDSHASGKVGGEREVGGLIGEESDMIIDKSFASGQVDGDMEIGGLIGNNSGAGEIRSSYALGKVGGKENVGGLVGWNKDAQIADSYASGDVSGEAGRFSVGGLVGNNLLGKISRSFASGNVSGGGSIGGLAGQNYSAEISYSYAVGSVSGSDGSNAIGGLIGNNTSGAIVATFASGDVSGDSVQAIGGLIGNMNGGSVSESYASGNVIGNYESSYVGGLAGENAGNVSDSYASGGVTGKYYVGGLVGYNHDVVIGNSYASGSIAVVSGSQEVGGLIGYNMSATTLDSFYDADTTGRSASAGGTSRSMVQMKTQSTYNSWDFTNIWVLDATRNSGYPYLNNAQVYLDYDGNGNDGGTVPDSGSYPPGAPVLLPTANLVKSGYEFYGWSTSVNGSGVAYKPGDAIKLSSETKLYARWIVPSADATLTSAIGDVSPGASPIETIANIPYGTKLSALKAVITPAADATFEVYDADGTTVATRLATGKKVIVTAQDGTTKVTYTVSVIKNSEKAITLFSLAEETNAATIDGTAHTVTIEVAYGTNLTGLNAAFSLSAGATAKVGGVGGVSQTSGTTANDFTGPVVYTVKAEDGSTQNWTVTVTVLMSAKDITSFSVPNQTKPAVIDSNSHLVVIEVVYGTNRNGMIATFALSPGATAKVGSANQTSGTTPNNFAPSVTYTVKAANGTTQDWMVIITAPNTETDIKSFSLAAQTGPAIIDATTHEIAIEVAYGTNVSSLIATFTTSPNAIVKVGRRTQTSNTTANNFTTPVTYVVRSEEGSTVQNWTVTVTVSTGNAKDIKAFSLAAQTRAATIDATAHTVAIEVAHGTNLSNLIATFVLSAGASAKVGSINQTSGTTPNDFSSPVTYTVTAANGTTQDWKVTVTVAASSAKDITAFSLAAQTGAATIDATAHTVAIEVAHGTNLSNLIATFALSAGATAKVGSINQASGTTPNNFTNLVTYVVTAANGVSTQNWTVTVTVAPALSNAATLTSTIGTVSINGTANESITNIPYGTTVASLRAAITPAANATFEIYDASGVTGAFTLATGMKVIVTAQNGTSKVTYTLSVNAAPSNGGGSTPPTDTKVNSTDGRLTLPAGMAGEVSLNNEVVVSIPANATDKQLKVTIDKVTDAAKLLLNNEILKTAVYEILKNFPENFINSVTLTFKFDPASLKANQSVAVFYYDEVKKSWVEVTGSVISGNQITVKVNHFTKYAVFVIGESTEEPTNQLSDIVGHWAEASIKQAVSNGIVTGYPDKTFKPNRTVTRAEFTVMLMNALKPKGAGTALTFTDEAKIGAWAKSAVAQAVQAGCIKGYEDGTFRPEAVITRAEMAMMVAKASGLSLEANVPTGFADDRDIPAWAKGAVAAIKKIGYIEGKGSNKFDPHAQMTRAEAVTVLLKVLATKE